MIKEYRVIFLSCLKQRTKEQDYELEYLFSEHLDWEKIGGQLLYHRLCGYFYGGLTSELRKRIPVEILKAIEAIIDSQREQFLVTIPEIKKLFEKFEQEKIRYAGLKGLYYFVNQIYKPGERRSNDIDLLVHEDDLDKLDKIFREAGYIQSLLKDGEFIEASRKEKIIQRMNYHDLIPYVKKTTSVHLPIIEFDINFLLDSQEVLATNNVLKYETCKKSSELFSGRILTSIANFAHLCIHYYREASNTLWTNDKTDVLLYKIVDIANCYVEIKQIDAWISFVKENNLQKSAYFTLMALYEFYPDLRNIAIFNKLKPTNTDYIKNIKVEGKNKIITRDVSFSEKAFDLKI